MFEYFFLYLVSVVSPKQSKPYYNLSNAKIKKNQKLNSILRKNNKTNLTKFDIVWQI